MSNEKKVSVEHTVFVEIEVGNMLNSKSCTICGKGFETLAERKQAVCSGVRPLTYAHGACFTTANR